MRLIDADRLKEAIHTDFCEHFTLYHDTDQTALIDMVMDDINEMPTAFDKEKVKEQIQIFRSKFECTCCPKNIGKHIPVSCDECMDTFAKANIVIVEKGGIE